MIKFLPYTDTAMLTYDRAQLTDDQLDFGCWLKYQVCVCLDQTPIIGKIVEIFRTSICGFDLKEVKQIQASAAVSAAVSASASASASAAASAAASAVAGEVRRSEIFKQVDDFANSYPSEQYVEISIVEGDEDCDALLKAIHGKYSDRFSVYLSRDRKLLQVFCNPPKITYSKEYYSETDLTYIEKKFWHLFDSVVPAYQLNMEVPKIQYIKGMQINPVCNPEKVYQLLTDKLGPLGYNFSLEGSTISVCRRFVSSAYFGESEIQPGQNFTNAGQRIQNLHKAGNAIVSLLVTNDWSAELGHVLKDVPYEKRNTGLDGQTLFGFHKNEVFNHGRISATCLKPKETSNVGVELYYEGVVGVMFDVVDKRDPNKFRDGVLATALEEYKPGGSFRTETIEILANIEWDAATNVHSLQKLKQTMNDPTHDNFKSLNEVIILNAMKDDLCGLIIDRKAWEKCDDAKQEKVIALIHEFKEISGLDLPVFMYDHEDNSLSDIAVCSK